MSKKRPKGNHVMNKMVRDLDMLAMYEEWASDLLPKIQKDLNAGRSAEEILDKYTAHAAARLVQNAILDPDGSKSNTAIKDILDRKMGKPTEKKEIEHRFGKLSDREIDALVATEVEELQEIEDGSE